METHALNAEGHQYGGRKVTETGRISIAGLQCHAIKNKNHNLSIN